MDLNVFETANAGFAQAIYEEFLRNPASVSEEWRRLFESGVVGEAPTPGRPSGNGAADHPPPAVPPAPAVTTASAPANATPLKGPAARLVANMNESLQVPTATTFREVSVAALERQRAVLNAALRAAGRPEKISFTHLIGYAIVQAVKVHPTMADTLAEVEGVPHRVRPESIGLGIAVDMERKDGTRGLVVPVIKGADRMEFAAFHATYESLVEKARTSKLMPDDFTGGTIQLTNPGGLGTVASVPRLMAHQGTIVAVGAIAYPPEFATVSPDRIRDLGLSRVMTLTSTYDHRIIQGAESGSFLRTIEQLLAGEAPFYEEVARSLGVSAGGTAPTAPAVPTPAPQAGRPASTDDLLHVAAAMALVKAFRTHGHLAARLDPLGSEPIGDPALDPAALGLTPEIMARIPASVLRVAVPGSTLAEALPRLRETYCGTIAYEVEHISDHDERVWLRNAIESGAYRTPIAAEDRLRLLTRLTAVEEFERFLHKAYLGQKRFSIEGVDALVPMLDLAADLAAGQGAREVTIGMAHRGRLNVLVHTVGRPYETILAEFEGHQARPDEPDAGTGDVKYHLGAEGTLRSSNGTTLTVSVLPNPSHLEFIGPVVNGRTRARQTSRRGREAEHDPTAAVSVVIHGDAAFAGQGVVAETLNLANLAGYGAGGTLHLITNNQIGFTTDMRDSRSTRHASDLAKGFDVAIIHVNADDPEACLSAVRLAMAYRAKFRSDVLIDLVGYRRWGHNEGDEPAYTQPVMYARIKDLPTARAQYAERLVREGLLSAEAADALTARAYQQLVEVQQALKAAAATPRPEAPPAAAPEPRGAETALPADFLTALNEQLLVRPEGFTVLPKLARQLDRRRQDLTAAGGIDWGHAEALAVGSLLLEGVPVRLTGQDSERGTFSHRHFVLHDVHTGGTWTPLQHLVGAQAPLEVYNSPLSELATMGFEYGYSVAAPEALVLWEGQFGDFVNGAQVFLDQFVAAGQSKWGQRTRLTLLLPHGYEGQGPEHSSARLERFLQLCAERNMRVANCTTPAQYFHLIRRQARHPRIRPLVVMSPKSLLRLPAAGSSLADLTAGAFAPVLDDPARPTEATHAVLCSGKVYYDLLHAASGVAARPALLRQELLYPFPADELREVLARYPRLTTVTWAQEEPRNMGGWSFVAERLRALLSAGVTLRYAGRPERASPAEGYPAAHAAAQARLVEEALRPA